MKYFLNIGTNLGDRDANLRHAIVALSAGTGGCQVSSVIESEPWGFQSEHRFLNVGVAIVTEASPQAVLRRLHDIERRLGSGSHRNATGGYADRLVDIDIMAITNDVGTEVRIDEAQLQVPHPHLHERDFFMTPLNQLKGHSAAVSSGKRKA